jgi:hypothetical protein
MIRFVIAKAKETIYYDYIWNFIKDRDSKLNRVVTNNEGRSMFEKYNIGLDYHKKHGLKEDDIICFVHEDVRVHDKHFDKKIEMVFKARPDIGLVGIMGTSNFVEAGGWWLSDRTKDTRGHIIQDYPGVVKKPYHMADKIGFFDDLVSIDGCCFFMSGKMALEYKFDIGTFDGWHFYDCDCSFSAIEMGYKVAVADILIEHASEGPLPDSWFKNRDKFLNKWRSKGITFPVSINSFNNIKTSMENA